MKKYYYLLLIAVSIPIQLSGQWAMWGNPSLPVGNSDQGVGLIDLVWFVLVQLRWFDLIDLVWLDLI